MRAGVSCSTSTARDVEKKNRKKVKREARGGVADSVKKNASKYEKNAKVPSYKYGVGEIGKVLTCSGHRRFGPSARALC